MFFFFLIKWVLSVWIKCLSIKKMSIFKFMKYLYLSFEKRSFPWWYFQLTYYLRKYFCHNHNIFYILSLCRWPMLSGLSMTTLIRTLYSNKFVFSSEKFIYHICRDYFVWCDLIWFSFVFRFVSNCLYKIIVFY